jgi:hypothetical protein
MFTYPVYYPNVELYEVDDDGSKCVFFVYNNQKYLIKGDIIVETDKTYQTTKHKRAVDFMPRP